MVAALVGAAATWAADRQVDARQAACLANVRQVSMAFLAYSADNRGYFPAPAYRPARAGGRQRHEDWVRWVPTPGGKPETAGVGPYLGDVAFGKVLVCPADDPAARPATPAGQPPYPFSYVMNERVSWAASRAPAGETARKVAQIRDPASKVLVYEQDPRTLDDGAGDPDPKANELLSVRHDGGDAAGPGPASAPAVDNRAGVIGCVDGHAEVASRATVHSPYHYNPLGTPGTTQPAAGTAPTPTTQASPQK
ncbi:MAG TPA: hypothetical protein VF796_00330 [Humisphaera sp.]